MVAIGIVLTNSRIHALTLGLQVIFLVLDNKVSTIARAINDVLLKIRLNERVFFKEL